MTDKRAFLNLITLAALVSGMSTSVFAVDNPRLLFSDRPEGQKDYPFCPSFADSLLS